MILDCISHLNSEKEGLKNGPFILVTPVGSGDRGDWCWLAIQFCG